MSKNISLKRTVLFSMVLFLFELNNLQAQQTDYKILHEINSNRVKSLDPFFNGISISTDYMAIALPLYYFGKGVVRHDTKYSKKGITSLVGIIGTYGSAYILKNTIKRTRPFIDHPDIENYKNDSGYSFPSGSTSSAFSTATMLSLQSKKWYVTLPSFAYAGTVAYSRLHLGAHYPSDVAAGAIIGAGCAFASFKLNAYVNKRFKTKNNAKK